MRALAALLLVLVAAPMSEAAPPPVLQACTIGATRALCGTVTVPENRALPDGRTIGLNVAVLPATSTPVRPDPLFYIPGADATGALPTVAKSFATINAHRDIVFVDQRGRGGSNPLFCSPPAGFPGTLAGWVSSCIASTGADVTHYRTVDAVDDLESVRVALGDAAVDLYGVSYGGTIVQRYLVDHPRHVRTAIMDSASFLDVPMYERLASNVQRALSIVHRRCLAQWACAHAYPHWYERLDQLLARLQRDPRRVIVDGQAVTVDAAAAADAVGAMTSTAEAATSIPFTLVRAEAANLDPLAEAILQARGPDASVQARAQQPVSVMEDEIVCTEPWAVRDWARVGAEARGSFYRYASFMADVATTAQVCAAWPKLDWSAENWSRPHSLLPVLDLVGQADPVDPAPNTAGFRAAMPNGKEIVVPGQGQQVAFLGCMPSVLARFLDAGTAKGLDTRCVSKISTPPFYVPLTEPQAPPLSG